MTIKPLKKLAALSLALLILLAGCQTADTTWAFELEGERLPSGAYILFQNQALINATDRLYQDWLAWDRSEDREGPEPAFIFDLSPSEMLSVEIDGMAMRDWVVIEGQRLARRHFAVLSLLDEYEIEVDPALLAQADAAARREYQQSEASFREIGVAESSLALTYRSSVSLNALFEGLYGEEGAQPVPEAEIRAYFDENFFRAQHLFFWKDEVHPEDFEGQAELAEAQRLAEQENARLRELANTYLERLRDGEAIEDLQYELDVELGGEDASFGRSRPGGLDVIIRRDTQNHFLFPQEMMDALGATAPGQSAMVESDSAIILIRRLDIFERASDLEDHREEIVHSLRHGEPFFAMLDERADELPIVANQNALSRYQPNRLLGV